jgi:hypothetical protein
MKVSEVNEFAEKEVETDRVDGSSTVTGAWGDDGSECGNLNGSGEILICEGSEVVIASGYRVERPGAVFLLCVNTSEESEGVDRIVAKSSINVSNLSMIQK